MIRRTMEFRNEREALAAEQAVAMVRELDALADAAADGQVLAVVEAAAVDHGGWRVAGVTSSLPRSSVGGATASLMPFPVKGAASSAGGWGNVFGPR